MRREQPQINAGSMADIAFLLLIFFLVAATMDYSKGLIRHLQPYNDTIKKNISEVQKRNVLTIFIDANNNFFVDNHKVNDAEIKPLLKDFIANPSNNILKAEKSLLSQKRKKELMNKNTEAANNLKNAITLLGDLRVSEAIILLKHAQQTKYEYYIKVQDIIIRAFNELREELALKVFKKEFYKLNNEQASAVKTAIPVSFAEPDEK